MELDIKLLANALKNILNDIQLTDQDESLIIGIVDDILFNSRKKFE